MKRQITYQESNRRVLYFFGILGGIVGFLWIAAAISPDSPKSAPTTPPAAGERITKDYADSIRDQGWELCSQAIEKKALYDFRWSKYAFKDRFRSFNVNQRADGALEMSGDEAEMQNGIGNWVRIWYQCDYNPTNKQIVGVQVNRGRLPW